MTNEIGITEAESGELEFRVILNDVEISDSILGVRFIADSNGVLLASLLIKPDATIVCCNLEHLGNTVEVTLGSDVDNKTTLWIGDDQVDMEGAVVQVGVFPEEGIGYLGLLEQSDLEDLRYSLMDS